jgi:general secretion pathway protein H
MTSSKTAHGFTLLELMVVLFIVILGFSALGINLSSGNNATEVKAAARDIVSALRYARGEALIARTDISFDMSLKENTYTVSSREKIYKIPKTIDVTLVTAQNELSSQDGIGSIRFFPDGSATGGRLTLERQKAVWQIDINWLTGGIEMQAKSGNDE